MDADAEEAAARKVEVVDDHRLPARETIIVAKGNAVAEVTVITIDHKLHAEVGATVPEETEEVRIAIEMASAEAELQEVEVAAAMAKKEPAVVAAKDSMNPPGNGNTRTVSAPSSIGTWWSR